MAGGRGRLARVGREQAVRPQLGGVAQAGGPPAGRVDHVGAVAVVNLAGMAVARVVGERPVDAGLRLFGALVDVLRPCDGRWESVAREGYLRWSCRQRTWMRPS